MRIKKIILIVLLLIILTGCTAKVNLEISDNVVYEEIVIDDQTTSRDNFREYIPIYDENIIVDAAPDEKKEGVAYYKKNIKDDKIYYSYAFNLKKYNDSKTMKNFFSSSAIVSSERTGLMELYTSNDGIFAFDLYPGLSYLEININTNLEVEESNADSVKGHTYTWVFTPSNKNKNIYIRMRNYIYKQKHPNEYKEKEQNKKNNEDGTNNSTTDSNNIGVNNEGIKADIRYKGKIVQQEKFEESQKSVNIFLIILGVIGVIIILLFIGMESKKKNR